MHRASLGKVPLKVHPRGKQRLPRVGLFATRSPNRPNPIALTLVKITKIDGRKIFVDEIEAFEGSPVLDIKPYLPNGDRVDEEICLPEWFEHLLVSRPSDRRLVKIQS